MSHNRRCGRRSQHDQHYTTMQEPRNASHHIIAPHAKATHSAGRTTRHSPWAMYEVRPPYSFINLFIRRLLPFLSLTPFPPGRVQVCLPAVSPRRQLLPLGSAHSSLTGVSASTGRIQFCPTAVSPRRPLLRPSSPYPCIYLPGQVHGQSLFGLMLLIMLLKSWTF